MNLEMECPATQEGCLLAMPRKRKTPTPADETFGQRLARLRKARGFSQTELGELLGVSQRVMTYYECQSERPPAYLLPRLAEALAVTVDELLGVHPVKETPAPRNTRLWRKLRDVEKLPPGDRKAVLKFVDALLVRQRVAGGSR
jgi:transcriptional regulator with XRE-family HTH domain